MPMKITYKKLVQAVRGGAVFRLTHDPNLDGSLKIRFKPTDKDIEEAFEWYEEERQKLLRANGTRVARPTAENPDASVYIFDTMEREDQYTDARKSIEAQEVGLRGEPILISQIKRVAVGCQACGLKSPAPDPLTTADLNALDFWLVDEILSSEDVALQLPE